MVALLAMAAATASAAPPEPATALLPDGPQRALVLRTCAVCHSIDLVVAQRRTEEQWDQLIGVMVDRGARATDDEQAQILEYLLKNFGRSDAAASVPPATHP
jgi:mono/diheme cytochrome c family protein